MTDASIVLGYLNPDYFAGGSVKLDPALARTTIEREVAKPLGLSVEEAALGIHRVVNATMAEGIRLVSVRQGRDPRDFTLVALGGAGPVHATALAADLNISSIVIPVHPGVLAAAGLLSAPTGHEVERRLPAQARRPRHRRPDRRARSARQAMRRADRQGEPGARQHRDPPLRRHVLRRPVLPPGDPVLRAGCRDGGQAARGFPQVSRAGLRLRHRQSHRARQPAHRASGQARRRAVSIDLHAGIGRSPQGHAPDPCCGVGAAGRGRQSMRAHRWSRAPSSTALP